ncbi:hypothetical protein [Moraxella sp. Pampa]|nr:hypothetical protein [Moraxella sp. Pampa]
MPRKLAQYEHQQGLGEWICRHGRMLNVMMTTWKFRNGKTR